MTSIYCLNQPHDKLTFYLRVDKDSYYLFQQSFSSGVNSYYRWGVRLDRALDFSPHRYNPSILNITRKLPAYIKYAEKEYGLAVLKKTQQKLAARQRLKRHPVKDRVFEMAA